ncbi:phage/plasmid primase, P4 family [Undibacter mobilis]|uniref:SF3 helicase domain-containing protein n=1 Tax=Undibacter mobilis TaxID=2292256 RepID=A0A371BAA9_9BRAD|nr:phage/plasmid primase, P4 family [Undibacter mobilis]RDV04518.1 hypothetical protein DXH78_08045 [Undibacter mobilis]
MSSKIQFTENAASAGVTRRRNRVSKRLRTVARQYAASHSLAVVPMHGLVSGRCACHLAEKCPQAGKHPASSNGVKDATSDTELVKCAWRTNRRANVGIATGKASGIVVLDIDPRNDGDATLLELEKALGKLPDTVTANTGGGGRHFVFKYPSVAVRNDSAGKVLGKGVDILSDGKIMVAPPSRHASGRRYEWAAGKSFDHINVAELPVAWIEKMVNAKPAQMDLPQPPTENVKIKDGARNTTLTAMGGGLRHYGATAEVLEAALSAFNAKQCEPPLDHADVQKIAYGIAKRYQVGSTAGDAAENMMRLVLDRHFAGGEHLLFGKDQRFWYYGGKFWEPADREWVRGRILETIASIPRGKQQTSSLVSQTETLLKTKLALREDPLAFQSSPPCVINCSNGELWIDDAGKPGLRPHNPRSYLRQYIDVVYNPKAKCPLYKKALLEIFSESENPARMRQYWDELAGYLMQPRRDYPMIPILLGSGSNGKTLLTRLLTALLGQNQVLTRDVESLADSRFAMGDLLGKLLFIDDDVKAGARLPDGVLKTISEEKPVTGEPKYGKPFSFVVRSVPVLLCNNVPTLADLSYGMLRRLVVIPFDRRFKGKDRDPQLLMKITEGEMSGILNRSLRGYARLVKRKGFKPPKPIRKATANWLNQANPIPAFVEEMCIKDADKYVWMKDLYETYKEWAEKAGYTMKQNQQSFRRNLEHLNYKAQRGNKGQKISGLDLKK